MRILPSPSDFRDKVFYSGPDLQLSGPIGCAAALATIAVYEEDGLMGAASGAWATC